MKHKVHCWTSLRLLLDSHLQYILIAECELCSAEKFLIFTRKELKNSYEVVFHNPREDRTDSESHYLFK